MLTKATLTAAAIAVTSPAIAATQLERSLGIAPGALTTAQITELKGAYDGDDRQRVTFILSGPRAGVSGAPATQQIVASALEENDFDRARFAASGAPNGSAVALAVIKNEAAASVGVDAEVYTLSRLLALQGDRQN